MNGNKKSILEKPIFFVEIQNNTAEIFFAYLSGLIAIIIFIFTSKSEYINMTIISLIFIIPAFVLSMFLIFQGEKFFNKIFPYHSDWLLMNSIQTLGAPVIIAAWFFYIQKIVIDHYKQFLEEGLILSSNNILNYLLLFYLLFFSIKFFTSASISKKDNLAAKNVTLNAIILIVALFISFIIFSKNISNPGFAFAQSFLVFSFLFEILNKLHTKITH